MDNPIEIVPAIKRLELRKVGCWEHLDLEFLPGLNIITEEGSAVGKTTIFKAILHSLIPTSPLELRPTPTDGYEQGSISIEFMSLNHSVDLHAPYVNYEASKADSPGQAIFRRLSAFLTAATPTMALLIDAAVTSAFDAHYYGEAVKMLNAARCQVICQIPHRLKLEHHPGARIFACFMETSNKVGMKLLQTGR